MAQGQNFRLLLVVHKRQHIDGKARLELCLCEQAVQDHLWVRVMLDFNDNAHTRAVGLVADIGNPLQALVVHLIGHVLDEHPLVHLIGKLGDDDARAVAAEFFKFRARAQDDLAAARGVGRADAAAAHDDALGREVGACHVLHQVVKRRLRVVEHAHAGVDDLGEVVRGDVRRHADGDTA